MGRQTKQSKDTGKTVEYYDKDEKIRFGKILKKGRKYLKIRTPNGRNKRIEFNQVRNIFA